MDCFAALAMTAGYAFAISPHVSREVWPVRSALPRTEGAGKAGCALHPRSRVQIVQRNAHEHTGSAEAVRPSLRNGFTAYNALSPVTGLSCHRRLRMLPQSLMPASGHQDHTPSPSASSALVRRTLSVHRIPLRVRDVAQRPSVWNGMAADIELICHFGKPEYFFEKGWTGGRAANEVICPSGRSGVSA
jgi:hypothetical protein